MIGERSRMRMWRWVSGSKALLPILVTEPCRVGAFLSAKLTAS
jgi:hypothetical protein